MPPLTALERYTQALERWVDDQLSDYNERLAARADGELATPKEINDPIWGTVDLSAAEVVVIDSPVFQRLRRIRQLGVVDLVYPSALHTRFEHSLGVTHLIGRMARSLQRHAPDDVTIDPSDVALLRMAALCHDIGHGTMSHVSERALKSLPAAEDACLQLARSLPVEKVELAEAASYVIVQSPAFQDLLRHAKRVAHDTDLSVNFHEEVAPLIVGKPVRERWPMMQELVSGPFDADKLDYITRDAVMSGVPVVADTVRLIEKLRLVALSQDELPERIARVAVGNHPAYYLFGVALSGGRTIDELMLGRTFLHDKLYRHHKVRSLEAMVGAVLELLAESNPDRALLLPYLIGDDAVVQLDEGELQRHGLAIADETARRTTLDISRRVGERRIFTRAYAFAKFMPSDPYRSDDEHATGLREAITACQESDRRVELERRCAELVLDAMKRLGLEVDRFDQLAPDELRRYLRIDPPQPESTVFALTP
jgi:HD superfamily phosphohydrolase